MNNAQKKWLCHQFYWFPQADLRWFFKHQTNFVNHEKKRFVWCKRILNVMNESHFLIQELSMVKLIWMSFEIKQSSPNGTNYHNKRNSEFVNCSARIIRGTKKSKMFINLLALEMVQKFHLSELSLQFKIDWMPKWTTESKSSDVAVLMPMERTN